MTAFRQTTQRLLPSRRPPHDPDQYNIYPAVPLPAGAIHLGFPALAANLVTQRVGIIDGDAAVLWDDFQHALDATLRAQGIQAVWLDMRTVLRTVAEIETLVAPFLGDNDPLFGTRFTGTLNDFFDLERLRPREPAVHDPLTIVYGVGAALLGWDGLLIYLDVPKNEAQFRARAGSVRNIGAGNASDPKAHYKRSYFVDWVVLKAHKAAVLPRIDLLVDIQRPDDPAMLQGRSFRQALETMSRTAFRPRPWFEPGPWGGQWLKRHILELPQDAPNLAWSFELIAPENGLLFESSGTLLEASLDWLLVGHAENLLGLYATYFGDAFPIRFDFLDTIAGGNLSLQCHPRLDYIRAAFGETFTQDETYYILDCSDDAIVYLGFRDDIDPVTFRAALDESASSGTVVDVARFVTKVAAKRHDLYLIPNGTVHCSGAGNLVLEISATPYIFTFKLYDWLRLDLEGRPRPLNVARAFENLDFQRKGSRVSIELVAQPRIHSMGQDWQIVHLPTHREHFYDVHRLEFAHSVAVEADGSVHVLMVVEGQQVRLELADGTSQRYCYAETFVVTASAGGYRLVNEGHSLVKVVRAFLKAEWFTQEDHQWLKTHPTGL